MIVRSTRLLLAFAVGVGCSVVFTFPSWSSGTVRVQSERQLLGASVAKLSDSAEPREESVPKLVIETKRHTLTVSIPGKEPIQMKAQGAYTLTSGSRTVVQKERDPVWQAPPTYFLRRGLPVPGHDSSSRFLKGALGHQALILEGSIALHSGPIWSEDVGGVRVSAQDMALLFDVVPVGARVEVR
jgi:hypothetical protein